MMKPSTIALLSLFCCSLAATPRCRQDVVFPYVSCETGCAWYSQKTVSDCQQKQQFGCGLQICSANGFQCTLDPSIIPTCPNNELPVEEVTLKPFRPVEFSLAFNLSEYMFDYVFLIDASNSTRPSLDAVMGELIKFMRNVSVDYNVGVGIYGSEQSFDARGFSVLQTVTSNVEDAVRAMQSIPILPDGPRTLIQALGVLGGSRTVPGGIESFGFRSRNRVFVLIGDTPGREVPCDAAYFTNVRSSWNLRGRKMVVNIASPGLNAALPPLPCDNYTYTIPEAHAPIQEGQGSSIGGPDMVNPPVTFEKLFNVYDKNRRYLPPRGYLPGWGRHVWITQNTTQSQFGYFQRPYPPPLSDGCNERVKLSTPAPWPELLKIPNEKDGRVRLEVDPWACRNGSFTCEVVIKDSRVRQFRGASSSNVDGHVHIIRVNAC